MSGGSFNYLYSDIADREIFNHLADLESMEDWLREMKKHDAADEILKFRLQLETFLRVARVMGQRLRSVVHAAEWWCSCDFGEDQFDEAWREFMNGGSR